MRIIGGKFRNKKINFTKNIKTRPLKDSVRENIFNILIHSNILDIEFSKNFPTKPFCVWINCDRKYKNLDYSAFPVINYSWFKTLGYIVPEYFRFWYLDWWICEVSRLSKNYFLSNVSIHQFHAETFEEEKDSTYKQNATNENLAHDYNMWLKTKNYRIKDSFKINSKK